MGVWKRYLALAMHPTCTQLAAGQGLMGGPDGGFMKGTPGIQVFAVPAQEGSTRLYRPEIGLARRSQLLELKHG